MTTEKEVATRTALSAALRLVVLALLALPLAVHGSPTAGRPDVPPAWPLGDAVFLRVDEVPDLPYYWDGSAWLPAPVVYFVRRADALWLEAHDGRQYLNVTVPLADGPYIAIPRGAFAVRPPLDGIPVDTPRGRAWLRLGRRGGEPPYGVVLHLDEGRRGEEHRVKLPQRGRGPLLAPAVQSYDHYLFSWQSPPISAGPYWAAVMVRNATGFGQEGYTAQGVSMAYLGYGVAYIYLAAAGSGSFSASLDLHCGLQPAYCGSVQPLWSYPADYGLVFVLDNWNRMGQYVWATAYLWSSQRQTARATLSAAYARPSHADGSWSPLVFQWRSVATPQGWTTTIYSWPVRRVMLTASVPQGASANQLWLSVSNIVVYNCQDRDTQVVRFYVGQRLVYTLTITNTNPVVCRTFQHGGFTVQAPQALDYLRLNTSHVPIVVEFDPPLVGTSAAPRFSAAVELYGHRWPQIWRENAANWITGLNILGTRPGGDHFIGNIYSFNLWNVAAFKNDAAGLIMKVNVETQTLVYALSISDNVEQRVVVSYLGFVSGSRSPNVRYICVAHNSYDEYGLPATTDLRVATPSGYADFYYFPAAASAGLWFINTILTFAALLGYSVPGMAGFVLWAVGTLISSAMAGTQQCGFGSYAPNGFAYDNGALVYQVVSGLFRFITYLAPQDRLTANVYNLAVRVDAYRGAHQYDYGNYTLYGAFKAPYIHADYRNSWFDAPLEPYRNDGGVMARVSP